VHSCPSNICSLLYTFIQQANFLVLNPPWTLQILLLSHHVPHISSWAYFKRKYVHLHLQMSYGTWIESLPLVEGVIYMNRNRCPICYSFNVVQENPIMCQVTFEHVANIITFKPFTYCRNLEKVTHLKCPPTKEDVVMDEILKGVWQLIFRTFSY
jgi:hypothetical protein